MIFMSVSSSSVSALRRFAQRPPVVERCELCGAALGAEHQHLMEPAQRRLVCACDACAVLFDAGESARYRRVPRQVRMLSDFRMSDAQWEGLHLPINLAFVYVSTPAGRVVAMYPGPAGATESLLGLDSWKDLVADNPVLGDLKPDVEALLIHRIGDERVYCRAPIDECYKLVGLIRTHWRGLSGGTAVWAEIRAFFQALTDRSGGHA